MVSIKFLCFLSIICILTIELSFVAFFFHLDFWNKGAWFRCFFDAISSHTFDFWGSEWNCFYIRKVGIIKAHFSAFCSSLSPHKLIFLFSLHANRITFLCTVMAICDSKYICKINHNFKGLLMRLTEKHKIFLINSNSFACKTLA